MCDLSGNNLWTREEFRLYNLLTSDQELDDAEWQVVEGSSVSSCCLHSLWPTHFVLMSFVTLLLFTILLLLLLMLLLLLLNGHFQLHLFQLVPTRVLLLHLFQNRISGRRLWAACPLATQPSVLKQKGTQTANPDQWVIRSYPIFIHHWTADGRGIDSFMSVVHHQYESSSFHNKKKMPCTIKRLA